MSVFVDTGVFVGQQNERDQHHDAAEGALATAMRGRFGRAFTSDYVYDEAVTRVRVAMKHHSNERRHREAKTVGARILGRGEHPDVLGLLRVTEDVFEAAVRTFEQYADHEFSFTDATIVAMMEEHGIDYVLSFDDDFDGIVDRLDPGQIG